MKCIMIESSNVLNIIFIIQGLEQEKILSVIKLVSSLSLKSKSEFDTELTSSLNSVFLTVGVVKILLNRWF